MKIELWQMNPGIGANKEELAKITLARFGLIPRKKDAKADFHRLLLELYERKKKAVKEKKPELSILTVDEMALFADIKRQTMYDYLKRWTTLQIIKRASFSYRGEINKGYELNGNNIEAAFSKASTIINNHLETSMDYIQDLQKEIKNEKLRA
tara:strand:- start:131 stop:589 length:459 start_codon:yes stop_codon:yes gene_type:complete